MTGFTTNEGLVNIAAKYYGVEPLTIGLFTNIAGTVTLSSEWADITQASGTGYAEIATTLGSWSIDSNAVVTYPQVQWTATADWAADVQGFYVRNTDGTPKLVHVQYRDNGAFPMTAGKLYTVDLSVDTS